MSKIVSSNTNIGVTMEKITTSADTEVLVNKNVKIIKPEVKAVKPIKVKRTFGKRASGGVGNSIIARIKQNPIAKADLIKEIEAKFPGAKVNHSIDSVICVYNKTAKDTDKIGRDSQKRFTIKTSLSA